MGKEEIVLKQLRSPVGCLPLRKIVKNKKKILIVTDDNTRITPLKKMLPVVIG